MGATFMEQFDYVTVAVAFDQHTVGLITAAADLCQRTGKKLCLLHVVEPWAEMPHSRPFGDGDPLWNVTQAVESNARDLAAGRLAELRSLVPAEISTELRVVAGRPLDCIGREAVALKTGLLLVGADFDSMRFLPRGFSTALSLMVASPVPVMVMNTAAAPLAPAPGLRLLLADDLGPVSETALEFAFALATARGNTEVRHVHVNALTLESLEAGLNTAAAAAHTPINQIASAREVFDALVQGLTERLCLRAAPYRDYLEAAAGTYSAEVVTGQVNEEIAAAAAEAHVLVFGRHHTYYTKPFFVGRLPYRSMLAQKRPVIIVPND